ncbi:ArsR/SmtB family transcription factor [Sutcliffiella halmapala]|uniref:ArsR/SmtB family transcription factor n=1 Tax=Sutcliffiella halmapala TaxID=79882 RepID=UPI000995BEE8|nr:metalloregulator ArsR/SmtB family transcription factor [Sutcliffiella halmapala]
MPTKSKLTDSCTVECGDLSKVKVVQNEISDEMTFDVAKIYRALSDPTRLKIAQALNLVEELCVHDVATIVHSTTATASHHLRLLRDLGLAKYRKDGKQVFYSLDDDHVKQLIDIAFAHQKEVKNRG